MSRYKSSKDERHMRGDPTADRWNGPLAPGDWVIVQGPMGYGYGYGQLKVLRPANCEIARDTNKCIELRIKRSDICAVVSSRQEAQAVFDPLERLRLSQPFQVFNQRFYAGRYRDLLAQAQT